MNIGESTNRGGGGREGGGRRREGEGERREGEGERREGGGGRRECSNYYNYMFYMDTYMSLMLLFICRSFSLHDVRTLNVSMVMVPESE